MAQGFSAELVGVLDSTLSPAIKADGRIYNAKLRAFQASFDLSQATVKKVNGDTNVCFKIPKGYHPIILAMNASVTMGPTATIAVGIAGTPGKYRAAAVFTAAALTLSMLSSAADDPPLVDDETVIITIAAADLPGAGILQLWMICTGR